MQKDITIAWSNFNHGGLANVSGTPVQLTEGGTACERGVLIKAGNTNTGNIYVGNSNSFTTTTGYELGAGESVFIEINRVNKVYVLASATNQKVYWLSV